MINIECGNGNPNNYSEEYATGLQKSMEQNIKGAEMTDKEYQHCLDIMEKGIRADERAKVLDEILALSHRYDMQDAGIHCDIVFKRDIEQLKEQK